MQRKWPLSILVASFVFVFVWFGIDKFVHPLLWIDFMPDWINGFLGMPRETWLSVMGVVEILMAAMLIVPVRSIRQLGALLISIHLLVIVWEIGLTDVGVRDIGLLGAAVAMMLLL